MEIESNQSNNKRVFCTKIINKQHERSIVRLKLNSCRNVVFDFERKQHTETPKHSQLTTIDHNNSSHSLIQLNEILADKSHLLTSIWLDGLARCWFAHWLSGYLSGFLNWCSYSYQLLFWFL